MKRNAPLCNLENIKKTKNLRGWPWICAERIGTSDTHTHTITHTNTHTHTHMHAPFSTLQYTYYTTWLSWTLTQGNVTENVNGELISVTAHCPVFVPDFEDITFYLWWMVIFCNYITHLLSVVCIYNPVSGLGVIQNILYGIICIGKQDSKYDHVFPQESKTNS
jgi:hypothetical protein